MDYGTMWLLPWEKEPVDNKIAMGDYSLDTEFD